MRVVDEFLARQDFLALRAALEAPGLPWEASHVLSPGSTDLDPGVNRQLVHGFYQLRGGREVRSPWLPLLAPLLQRLEPTEWIKIKANRTPRLDRHVEYGLHVDTRRGGATTTIFYLNSNNGYTVFEDGTRVASVANRAVIFDAALRHTGASCTDAPERMVLNLNLVLAPGRWT